MTSKLAVYNGALLILGQRKLSSLSEAIESRRALDDAYDGTLRYCIEQGFWNFAMRAVQADSSASVEPTFGYSYAFAKPSDWIRTYRVSADEEMITPLLTFVDEPNYWYANVDPIFVKYVSDDTAYGGDLSIWPETFANYVEHRLAYKTCKRITGTSPDEVLVRDEKRARIDARSKDAMNEPSAEPPTASWVSSRAGSLARGRLDGTDS